MSRRDRVTGRAALALGLVGAVLMLAVDSPSARAVGVLCLVAFVVLGLLRIASPEYLGRGGESE